LFYISPCEGFELTTLVVIGTDCIGESFLTNICNIPDLWNLIWSQWWHPKVKTISLSTIDSVKFKLENSEWRSNFSKSWREKISRENMRIRYYLNNARSNFIVKKELTLSWFYCQYLYNWTGNRFLQLMK
jgi:hypothetical protein